jgi:protein-tyrosine-phosphatase
MTSILVLCHGNINRSPLAAAVLAQNPRLSVRQGRLKFGHRLEKAAKKMREAAAPLGLDLSAHRSRDVTLDDLLWADIIVYMDAGNRKRLIEFAGEHWDRIAERTVCLGVFANPQRDRIPDPAFIKKGSPKFAEVVDLIKTCSEELSRRL